MNNCHYMITRSVYEQDAMKTLGELTYFLEEYARVLVSGNADLSQLKGLYESARAWKAFFTHVPKTNKRFLQGQILAELVNNNGLFIPVMVWIIAEMIELLETYWEDFIHDDRLSGMLQNLRMYSWQIREYLPN